MQDDDPSKSSVFRHMSSQNVFNFVHDYKVTSDFKDDELGLGSHVIFK